MRQGHFRALEQMYLNAPVQSAYPHISIVVLEGSAQIQLPVLEQYFHSASAVHGAVYFKLLDDAAYFAAASLNDQFFLVTASFEIKLLRPIDSGIITAKGICKMSGEKTTVATAELFDGAGNLLATGTGRFALSKLPLSARNGYLSE